MVITEITYEEYGDKARAKAYEKSAEIINSRVRIKEERMKVHMFLFNAMCVLGIMSVAIPPVVIGTNIITAQQSTSTIN